MDQPNFLFIITDQQRHDHLGCAGNTILKTPNIDAIAAQGTRFENFYVASAVCMPNRASIMTGRMPSAHGVRFNGIPLARESVTFVDLLRASGYQTALIGKSHLQNFTEMAVTYPQDDSPGTPPPDALSDAMRMRFEGAEYEYERVSNQERSGYRGLTTPFYGFDHVELCTRHGDRVQGHYADWLESRHPNSDALRSRDNLIPDERYIAPQAYRTSVPEALHSTAYVAERTQAYMEAHASQKAGSPFYIQCSFPDPHHPFAPPGKYWDMYDPDQIPLPASFHQDDLPPTVAFIQDQTKQGNIDRTTIRPFAASEREMREIIALTYGMIANVDDAVGRVLATLRSLGLDKNTIVVFTSDHGDFMGDHGIVLKGPLHYKGVAKVPFLWRDPALESSGRTLSGLGQSLDIASTVLARAGLAPFSGMQGRDLGPMLRGERDAVRDRLLIEQDAQQANFGFSGPIRARTLINCRWRLSTYQGSDFAELYDLENDPEEVNNLWGSHPEQAQLLRDMVDEMTDLQDSSPRPTMYA